MTSTSSYIFVYTTDAFMNYRLLAENCIKGNIFGGKISVGKMKLLVILVVLSICVHVRLL